MKRFSWSEGMTVGLVGVLLAALFLPGCTPRAGAPPTDNPMTPIHDVAPIAGSPTGASAPLNPGVSGTVEFWHFWGSPVRRTAVRRIVALCQKQLPNIQVTEVFKPWGDIWTANIAAVAAGSGMPDVIVEDRPQLGQRARDQVVQSLQPYVERDGLDSAQFWPFTWNEAVYQNAAYGIPFETDVRVLFWNKAAFREAGLDPEAPPQTWEELWAYADRLDVKNPDGTYQRIGFFPLWNGGPDLWALTNGYAYVRDGRPVADDPAFAETLTWIKRWVDRYGGWEAVQKFRAQFGAPPNDLFMSGQVAMVVDIGGYHSILGFYRPQYQKADGSRGALEWGIGALPYNTVHADWSGGFALSIPKGARNPEAAWEFIKCATGPEAQISWARDTAAIPANQLAANDSLLMADPMWKAIVENMQWSTGTPYLEKYSNWMEQLPPRYERIWKGELAPEAALQEAQRAVDTVLDSAH